METRIVIIVACYVLSFTRGREYLGIVQNFGGIISSRAELYVHVIRRYETLEPSASQLFVAPDWWWPPQPHNCRRWIFPVLLQSYQHLLIYIFLEKKKDLMRWRSVIYETKMMSWWNLAQVHLYMIYHFFKENLKTKIFILRMNFKTFLERSVKSGRNCYNWTQYPLDHNYPE